MNILNLPGPQFLGVYVVLALAAFGIAALLRHALRGPDEDPPARAAALDPYAVAYLTGGERLAIDAAITRLVHDEAVYLEARKTRLMSRGRLPDGAADLERAVHEAAGGKDGNTLETVRGRAGQALGPLKEKLREMGLTLPPGGEVSARLLPLAVVLSVVALGVVKILVGLSRQRPVLFLVLLCVASAIAAFIVFGRAIHRSRMGDRVLARLKQMNSALEFQAGRRLAALSGDDLVLGLGLFGLGILTGGPLSDLETVLRPPRSNGAGWFGDGGSGFGCGGGDSGGSSCGGGCGGGGCGGCGG